MQALKVKSNIALFGVCTLRFGVSVVFFALHWASSIKTIVFILSAIGTMTSLGGLSSTVSRGGLKLRALSIVLCVAATLCSGAVLVVLLTAGGFFGGPTATSSSPAPQTTDPRYTEAPLSPKDLENLHISQVVLVASALALDLAAIGVALWRFKQTDNEADGTEPADIDAAPAPASGAGL